MCAAFEVFASEKWTWSHDCSSYILRSEQLGTPGAHQVAVQEYWWLKLLSTESNSDIFGNCNNASNRRQIAAYTYETKKRLP